MYPAFFINTSKGTINRNAIAYIHRKFDVCIVIHLIGGQTVVLADEEATRFLNALAPSLTIGELENEDESKSPTKLAPSLATSTTES